MSLLLPQGQQPDWCPRTTNEVLPSVLGLLPPGPAWDGAHVEGTIQNAYWRALSNVLAYTYGRLCDYVDEFFCATVKESLDQWVQEYALDDPCDPYGHNLCAKVAAQGGATCDYFVQMAAMSGWVITCDTPDIPEPIAGCFQVGCTPLGPTPTFVGTGSRMGYGQVDACRYGEVVQHPDPTHWDTTKTSLASCIVPGSNLGFGPDTDESCCFICGYFDFVVPPLAVSSDYCQNQSQTITFECPDGNREDISLPCPSRVTELRGLDDSENYSEWGHAYVWEVTVDMAASQAAQSQITTIPGPTVDPTAPSSQAGCFMVGVPLFTTDGTIQGGTPLCFDNPVGAQATYALCVLDRIKPAHTTLNVKVIQP